MLGVENLIRVALLMKLSISRERIFCGVVSSKARTIREALLEAMVEAGITARNHGFQQILFLSYSKELLQSFKKKKAPDWLDSSRMADLIFLTQCGLSYNMIFVPHLVVKEVWSGAKLVTHVPMNQCWFSPALL